jgi:hypothetical protein
MTSGHPNSGLNTAVFNSGAERNSDLTIDRTQLIRPSPAEVRFKIHHREDQSLKQYSLKQYKPRLLVKPISGSKNGQAGKSIMPY